MDVDPYELLVRWYLRFNGFLSIENFVLHDIVPGGNVQVGETDILAVRFPHSREDKGFPVQNDPALLDGAAANGHPIDFVIAEVKGGQNAALNKIWRPPASSLKVERVSYLIRWLGPVSDDQTIEQIATTLQAAHRAQNGQFVFRVVMFAQKRQNGLTLNQITFRDIADFLVRVRVPSWENHGFGSRSPHNQWHPFIKQIWKVADPQTGADAATKIDAILDLLKQSADKRAGAASSSANS